MRRKNSNRLQGYDYSLPGAYFVTLVTQDRFPLFARLDGGRVFLNATGEIAKEEWLRTTELRKEIRLDQFIVMPNHLHAILFIDDLDAGPRDFPSEAVGAHGRAPLHRRPRSLGAIVAGYKAASTKKINQLLGRSEKVWQRNYFDHVIRD